MAELTRRIASDYLRLCQCHCHLIELYVLGNSKPWIVVSSCVEHWALNGNCCICLIENFGCTCATFVLASWCICFVAPRRRARGSANQVVWRAVCMPEPLGRILACRRSKKHVAIHARWSAERWAAVDGGGRRSPAVGGGATR